MMHPFELLAEPMRRRIVEVLALGDHPAGDLISVGCHEFGVTRAAVSHHLRILRNEDAVLVEIDESSRIYRLNPELLDSLTAKTEELMALWEQRYGSRYQRAPQIGPVASSQSAAPSVSSGRHRAAPKKSRGKSARNDPWPLG
jgi:DNA-binding transcriptional ArsR family regulator